MILLTAALLAYELWVLRVLAAGLLFLVLMAMG